MNDGAVDLTMVDMIAVYAMMAVPIALVWWLRLGIVKDTLISMARMSIQLSLVGLYLKIIFELHSLWLNLAWLAIMMLVANATTISKAGLVRKQFFLSMLGGISISTTLIVAFFVGAVIQPEPLYNARYLIPISGMVLGNCMRGNVLSLERFFSGIRDHEKEFITYQMLGANLMEACRPYMRNALKAALAPTLSTMATMGIVSLPGMMTGQILGGSFPLNAIKYQIAIMFCIFTGIAAASILNLLLGMRIAFDEYGMLKHDIWA